MRRFLLLYNLCAKLCITLPWRLCQSLYQSTTAPLCLQEYCCSSLYAVPTQLERIDDAPLNEVDKRCVSFVKVLGYGTFGEVIDVFYQLFSFSSKYGCMAVWLYDCMAE